jgi:hypothetical protein
MIRSGLLNRDLAIQKLNDQSEKQLEKVMDQLGVTKAQLRNLRH